MHTFYAPMPTHRPVEWFAIFIETAYIIAELFFSPDRLSVLSFLPSQYSLNLSSLFSGISTWFLSFGNILGLQAVHALFPSSFYTFLPYAISLLLSHHSDKALHLHIVFWFSFNAITYSPLLAQIFSAITVWAPMVSMVTICPLMQIFSSNSGSVVILLFFVSTTIWPRLNPSSRLHAVTRWFGLASHLFFY